MKEFMIQLEVHASADISDTGRNALDGFVDGVTEFSTISYPGNEGHTWVYAYDGSSHTDLDDIIRRMIGTLPPVGAVMKLESIDGAVVSVGVMSDQYATSADLRPETLGQFSKKLKGVGLQFVFYLTDFGECNEADTNAQSFR